MLVILQQRQRSPGGRRAGRKRTPVRTAAKCQAESAQCDTEATSLPLSFPDHSNRLNDSPTGLSAARPSTTLGLLEAGFAFSTLPRLRTKALLENGGQLKARGRAASVPELSATLQKRGVTPHRKRACSLPELSAEDEAHLSDDCEADIRTHEPTLYTGMFRTSVGHELIVT